MMKFKRGDIVIVLFPYADMLTVKQRPALVVQADTITTDFQQCILALITSNLARAGRPQRVSISIRDPRYKVTGLKDDSVIIADHLATVNEKLISRKIGVMPDMKPVDNALRIALSL